MDVFRQWIPASPPVIPVKTGIHCIKESITEIQHKVNVKKAREEEKKKSDFFQMPYFAD